MDDPEVAMKALTASGLDAAKLFARAQEPEVKAKLIENTQMAVERGAFGGGEDRDASLQQRIDKRF